MQRHSQHTYTLLSTVAKYAAASYVPQMGSATVKLHNDMSHGAVHRLTESLEGGLIVVPSVTHIVHRCGSCDTISSTSVHQV